MQKFFKDGNNLYPIFLLLVFAVGIYLRTRVYLTNQSFWHDECALAWNIVNRSYRELFEPLRFLQSAPILFLITTKYLTEFFGKSEPVFRFIPYCFGVLSMVGFYFLSKKILKTKPSIIFSNILFAVNLPLYYYSAEFKPYSTDVFFCILALILFENLNKKVLLIYSIILSAFIWFSFPAVFVLTAVIALIILNSNYSIKEKIVYLIPQILNGLVFYKVFFAKMFSSQKAGMTNYWQNEFINPQNFVSLFQKAFNFMFHDGAILIILAIAGLFIFLKEQNKFGKFALTLFLILISASCLQLYPFSSRLILFLIPIMILLITKTFDSKHFTSINFFILFIFCTFSEYKSTINTVTKDNYSKNNPNPREMTEYIKSQLKTEDIIYVNSASNSDYLYYKQIYNIKNRELINTPQYIRKNDKIWFFLPNDGIETYEKIIKNNYKILYENRKGNSILIYAQKIT